MRIVSDLSGAPAHTAVDVQAVDPRGHTAGPSQAVVVGFQTRTAAGDQAVLVPSCTAGRSQAVVAGACLVAVTFWPVRML